MGWLVLALLAAAIAKSAAPKTPKAPGSSLPPGTPTSVPADFKAAAQEAAAGPSLTAAPITMASAPQPFAALSKGAIQPLATYGSTPSSMSPEAAAWPGIQSLPPAYRDPALAAVQHLRYSWIMATEGPVATMDPCSGGPCTSAAVYTAWKAIHTHAGALAALAGGLGGAQVDRALDELGRAYSRLVAVGR